MLLTHRWLGIVLGLLVFAWCASGFVMMYVPYPSLSVEERLGGLAEIDLTGCCTAPTGPAAATAIERHAVEMLAGRLVLRVERADGSSALFDLRQGRWLEPRRDLALRAGIEFAARQNLPAPRFVDRVERDQWTVQGAFDRHRPMYRFAAADGTEWYVSAATLQTVQLTGARERLWNWLGAVVHWLYPTVLRQHVYLWSQVVIITALAGLFLTVTGVVIGIRQFGWRGRPGRRTPYRGWRLWHHYSGLVFGVLTLTWLLSGLLSMNPWGWLDGRSYERERAILNGGVVSLREAVARLDALRPHVPPGTVRLESRYWLGQAHYVARDAAGAAVRLDLTGPAAAIDVAAARAAARAIRTAPAEVELIDAPDAYYYPHHHAPREFPVLRLGYPDGERLYLSPVSGALLLAVDGSARTSRWLYAALHRGDFHALVRSRPFWDLMMLVALAGVTAGAGSGAYLGLKRLLR